MTKKSYDIKRLLNKYRLEYKEASAGRELILNCLWHNDRKHHLYINASSGLYNCFSCGAKGTVYGLISQLKVKKSDIEYVDLKNISFGKARPAKSINKAIEIKWPEGYVALTGVKLGAKGKTALEYLNRRGITNEEVSYYQIGYCFSGPYSGRVIVPVFDEEEENKLVSFIARDYTGKLKPKVLTPPAETGHHGIKDYLFNFHRAKKLGVVLIGEGVFDAISLGVRGICLFGKTITSVQLAKLLKAKISRVIIALDPDAQKEAYKLAGQLTNHIKDVRIATIPEGYDPNSLPKKDLETAINEAKPINSLLYLNKLM